MPGPDAEARPPGVRCSRPPPGPRRSQLCLHPVLCLRTVRSPAGLAGPAPRWRPGRRQARPDPTPPPPPETAMRPADLRQIYQPRPERLPRWVLRVWGWF